ncbi:hypothetical protein ScPMuIL_013680 [Solemya velum]
MADDTKENADSLLADIQRRIQEAFDIFDHEANKTVDVREVGTIIRSLVLSKKDTSQPRRELLKAFQVLDSENKGYLTQEELTKYMSEEGEPFTQEELEEMLSAAIDPEKRTILYRDYASVMAVEET